MTFFDRIKNSFIESGSWTVNLAGLILSILGFLSLPADHKIDTRYVLIIIIFLLCTIFILIRACQTANNDSKIILPRVIKVIDAPKSYNQASALLLISPNEILSHESAVSIYFLENDIEKFIGIGIVINIQIDKKIQVALSSSEDSLEMVKKFKENQPETISKIIVKPSVPKPFLDFSNV